MKFKEILEQIGLGENESAVYSVLLETGQAPVQTLAKQTKLKRPTVYHALAQLVKRGLAEEVKRPGKKEFRAASPENLERLLALHKTKLTQAEKTLEYSLPQLVSQYLLSSHRPYVVHYEGKEGIRILHKDVIKGKNDILFIRSPHDTKNPEINRLIIQHIQDRVRAGIRTRNITPLLEDTADIIAHDKERLIERRIIPKDQLLTSAQIMIYGEKVALTSYGTPLITTIIENKDIRDTFVALFEYIWEKAGPEHEKIMTALKKEDGIASRA